MGLCLWRRALLYQAITVEAARRRGLCELGSLGGAQGWLGASRPHDLGRLLDQLIRLSLQFICRDVLVLHHLLDLLDLARRLGVDLLLNLNLVDLRQSLLASVLFCSFLGRL